MATEIQNLQTALTNITAKLAAVTADPKPTYSIDGRSYSWGEYYSMLVKMRNDLKEALVNAEGPWERRTIIST